MIRLRVSEFISYFNELDANFFFSPRSFFIENLLLKQPPTIDPSFADEIMSSLAYDTAEEGNRSVFNFKTNEYSYIYFHCI